MSRALLAMLLVLAASAQAEESDSRRRDFIDAHSESPLLVLLESRRLDVELDAGQGGVVGTRTSVTEFLVTSREGIDQVNRQGRVFDPVLHSVEFAVEIRHSNGKTTRFDADDLDWVEVDGNSGGVYTLDRRMEYSVIPRIGIGDRVRLIEVYELRGTHGMPPLSFGGQADVPVLRAELEVRHPDDHELVHEWLGAPDLLDRIESTSADDRDEVVVRAWIEDLSGRRREPGAFGEIPRGLQWVGHFSNAPGSSKSFAAGQDWATIGNAYLERVEPLLEPDLETEAEARRVVGAVTSDEEAISLLYEYVQRECRYLGLFEGLGGLIPEPASSTRERRYGDCKGLSVLLISMIRALDIEAWPALLLAGDSGPFATSVPNLAQFNHFIVWANDTWLDPVYDFCPAGLVPSADARYPVLLLRPGATGLVEIDPESSPAGTYARSLTGTVNADGTATLVLTESATGNAALRRRLRLGNRPDDEAGAALANQLFGTNLRAAAASTRIHREDSWKNPWRAEVELDRARLATVAGRELFIPFASLDVLCPALDTKRRTAPLHLRDWPSEMTHWDLAVPEELEMAPLSEQRSAPGMEWSIETKMADGRLRLRREISFEPVVLEPEQVLELAKALEEIAAIEKTYLQLKPVGGR